MTEPLIRHSGLSDRWYVVTRWRKDPKHPGVIVASVKHDVTDQMRVHLEDAVDAAMSAQHYGLWDTDSGNLIGAYVSLDDLVQAAFRLGQANPSVAMQLGARFEVVPEEGLEPSVGVSPERLERPAYTSSATPAETRIA